MKIFDVLSNDGGRQVTELELLIAACIANSGVPTAWPRDSIRRLALVIALDSTCARSLLTAGQLNQFMELLNSARSAYANITTKSNEQIQLFDQIKNGGAL